MRKENYYDILGIPRDGSEEEITRAFRTLARKYHPDVSTEQDAEDRFKEINEAYSVLSDSEKRGFYDRYGSDWEHAMNGSHEPWGQSSGASGDQRWGGSSFYSNPGEQTEFFYEDGAGGGADFRDFFEGLFSGGEETERRTWFRNAEMHARGRDIEADISLRIIDLVMSETCTISLDGKDGTHTSRKIEVKIPPGVTDGSVIRLKGQGEPGIGNDSPGDLRLRIRLAPDERFTVNGYDLETEATLSPWEAALGEKIDVETPSGSVRLAIPPGTRSHRRFRLRGKGLPRKEGSGDLFVRIRIDIPETLSEKERALFEELSRVSACKPRKHDHSGPGSTAGNAGRMDKAA